MKLFSLKSGHNQTTKLLYNNFHLLRPNTLNHIKSGKYTGCAPTVNGNCTSQIQLSTASVLLSKSLKKTKMGVSGAESMFTISMLSSPADFKFSWWIKLSATILSRWQKVTSSTTFSLAVRQLTDKMVNATASSPFDKNLFENTFLFQRGNQRGIWACLFLNHLKLKFKIWLINFFYYVIFWRSTTLLLPLQSKKTIWN